MTIVRVLLPGLLALAASGCVPDRDPSTFAIPDATLAPLRLATCPAPVAAAARATRCPEDPR